MFGFRKNLMGNQRMHEGQFNNQWRTIVNLMGYWVIMEVIFNHNLAIIEGQNSENTLKVLPFWLKKKEQ
ncbi:unnamed protein product [Paramecium octaurelia]|uniref:Uncharacterized protein n=1 Tax=Paramecium octaurelia TaxID=43137 RepID=A0A8S1VBT7_PAROT|nr:unnamed protein product [Paramecium octaurelia]